MTRYEKLKAKMLRGQMIILDGGTGTDIQRRGAPMSGDTWCADANLTSPAIVRSVHDDYIAAGADMITANTYASSPLTFSILGRTADVHRIDAIAMKLALDAAAGTDVCVAGSMSTMRPMQSGSDRNNLAHEWPEQEARKLFRMKAAGLKEFGAECILMEMMRDTDYAIWASEAALETGLPVWIGMSAEKSAKGGLQGWGRDDCNFEDMARVLSALKPDVMCIMHTSPEDTGPAIDILRKYWDGPIGAYPESGYFKSPEWLFTDLTPDGLSVFAKQWRSQGVSIVGGCCGIGPDHIHHLHAEFTK